MGYSVESAADGEEGWDKVLSFAPDLVITDLMMPRLHGLDLLDRIRRAPRTKTVPVLCMTSDDDIDVKQSAASQGATGWIQKPFHPETWGEMLKHILQQ